MDTYRKLEIAVQLLESVIDSYIREAQYFSAIHLAGGAEELLGKYVRIAGEKDSLSDWAEAMNKIGFLTGSSSSIKKNKKYINWAKNNVKHMDTAADDTIEMDAKEEAKDLIERAISNFNRLGLNPTSKVLDYYAAE